MRECESLVGWKPVHAGRHVPSARLRCRAPLAALRSEGYPVELFQKDRSEAYRVVVLQKLYDAEHLALARRLQARGTRVVLDLCDNYLYTAGGDPELVRRADALRRMLDVADAVTVPTSTLAEALPREATVIRDGVEPFPGLRLPSLSPRSRRLELIWFGVWGHPRVAFGMRDVVGIRDALAEASERGPLRLTVVSNSSLAYRESIAELPFPTRYVEWRSHRHLCGLIPRHDACVIPVGLNPYSACKSPNRLCLSLSLGVPVLATAVPSYEEFRPFCTLDDWDAGLRAAASGDAGWRRRSAQGTAYVLGNHMMRHAADEWRGFFDGMLAMTGVRVLRGVLVPERIGRA